ncbi:MAG TPA: arsenate reductase ArsC [Candidatus Binatia bacterium]|nr:arsenate reductase ArsC [Candidatus Binatia bacterium]
MRRNVERNVLFLCEDNACLSQIAEAAAKHLAPPRTRIFSAGVKPTGIPVPVVQAMQELGISMKGQKSKSLAEVPIQDIDLVVSFADAHKQCANLPGRVRIERWPIEPARLADEAGENLQVIRDRRDEIDKRVFALFLDHWRNVPRAS